MRRAALIAALLLLAAPAHANRAIIDSAVLQLSAKGDLMTHNGSIFAKLGVGADALCLITDSAEATGLKWGACGSGSGAPTTVDYFVGTADGGLSAERVGTDTTSIDVDIGTASQAKWHIVDRDYGDITTSATGATWTIDNGAVSFAELTAGAASDAQIDGSLEADEVNPTLGSQTQGDYVASATANQGLLLTGTEAGSLGLIDCAATEILKRNAGDTAWECASAGAGGGISYAEAVAAVMAGM